MACDEVSKKKKIDTEKAKILKIKESLCVQCLHIGSYDDEPTDIYFSLFNNLTAKFSNSVLRELSFSVTLRRCDKAC